MGITSLSLLLVAVAFTGTVQGQNQRPPEWVKTLDRTRIREDTPVGTTIGTLEARDPQQLRIFYVMTADMFLVDRDSGVVRLTRPLDFEDVTEKVLRVKVSAFNAAGLESSRDIEISVIDVNDENAKFSEAYYAARIPEDAAVGTTVFKSLTVIDRDLTNAVLQVSCNSNAKVNATSEEVALFQEACDKFNVVQTVRSERVWQGYMLLKAKLDYETTSSYKIPLQTFDGKNYEVGNFEVFVIDVNDAPPRFTRLQPATVAEGLPKGSNVTYVQAKDTDATNPRPVRYTFVSNPGNFFALDRVTGNIVTNVILDRDTPALSRGFVPLTIKASEVIGSLPDGTEILGTDQYTTVVGTIQINIEDKNDNTPTFHDTHFTVSIREDIANNSPLPGLIMTITDTDQGTFNMYNLVLLDNTDRFAVFPEQGQERSTASIKVTNTNLIDYETGPRQYILRVQARETQTNPRLTGSTTVTVNVIDVNDNNPVFLYDPGTSHYEKTISERTPAGTSVVKISVNDPDSGIMGTAGVQFALVGNGAEKFRIDPTSGTVTVGPCNSPDLPGSPNCLDYETLRRYDLTVTATDEQGSPTGRTNTAPLVINLLDENDNFPTFLLSAYTEYIREGRQITVNPLIVKAEDPDTVPRRQIQYSIGGSESVLWTINSFTGNITARQPIFYAGDGVYRFETIATDGQNNRSAPVTIYVIDENDKQPRFVPNSQYTETIPETTPGNTVVLTVRAIDDDDPSTANGIIDYVIDRGDQGLFVVNFSSGVISTASGARFDYEKQQVYQMIVLARDRGNPQLTGTATVTVSIRDSNNKLPYFVPTMQQADISERVAIGTFVLKVSARDPDVNPTLLYSWCGPKSAITPQGVSVSQSAYDYENLFSIDSATGRVTTANKLNRDRASVITYTMCVEDTNAPSNARQIGTGTVIITVLEYNDQAPHFEQNPYNITIDEEMPLGTFVQTLVAFDEDDGIAEYRLTKNPGALFSISRQTGVLTINRRIDYETLTNTVIRLEAQALDDGNPQMVNTTQVVIHVRNINDNSPAFGETIYKGYIDENPVPGVSAVNVSATDLDRGDYGRVFYGLPASETRFAINNQTGEIVVVNGTSLDREVQSIVVVQVTAYDSPLDPTVRRSYAVPVYIYLNDKNDNEPQFTQAEYTATIIETIDVYSEVLQVFATDLDIGPHAAVVFRKVPGSGDINDYFAISTLRGRVTVNKGLRGKDGIYAFNVSVTDNEGRGSPRFTNYAKVTITVLEATNSPPRWVIPPRENFTIEVLESQYLGMLVYDVEAEDLDSGDNGVVDYMFYESTGYTTATKEFRINSITGVIRAERVYDREEIDRYVLLLVARDRGNPFLESTRFLTVKILDVNDHVPEFPMAGGATIPYNFEVSEQAGTGQVIGQVKAIDKDTNVTNSRIFYYILAGNEASIFNLNRETGILTLLQRVDRESKAAYSLDILATNNISDYTVRTRRRRSTDPSIVTVNIAVGDVNDQAPQFTGFPDYQRDPTKPRYHGCVSRSAPYGRSILRVSATDADLTGPADIRFNVTRRDDFRYFSIDAVTGVLFSQFLSGLQQSVYETSVSASDFASTTYALVEIFIFSPENEVKLIVSQPPSEVRLFENQIQNTLRGIDGLEFVCVSRISDHVLEDGTVSNAQTDVYVTGVRRVGANQYDFYPGSDLLTILTAHHKANNTRLATLYITQVLSTEQQQSVVDRTAVLAVLIIIILLIILFLILICLACVLIRNSRKKRIRKAKARSMRAPMMEPSFQEAPKGVNVEYDNRGFELEQPADQYAVVKKPRPPTDEMVEREPIPPPELPEPEEPVPVIITEVEPVQAPPLTRPDSDDDDNDYEPEPVIVTEVEPGPADEPSPGPSSPSSHRSQPASEPGEEEEEFKIVTEVM